LLVFDDHCLDVVPLEDFQDFQDQDFELVGRDK
jgi:hypothetical protein